MVVVSLLNVAVAAAVIALERMDMALEGTRETVVSLCLSVSEWYKFELRRKV